MLFPMATMQSVLIKLVQQPDTWTLHDVPGKATVPPNFEMLIPSSGPPTFVFPFPKKNPSLKTIVPVMLPTAFGKRLEAWLKKKAEETAKTAKTIAAKKIFSKKTLDMHINNSTKYKYFCMAFFEKIRKFYSGLGVLELVLLMFAIVFIIYALLAFFLGTTSFFATVVSGSMKPALERGDMVVLAKAAEYRQGDIIVFKRGEDIIIHRVALVVSNGYKTKGDNNSYTDFKTVEKKDVLGKAIFVIPNAGNINLYLAGK